LEKVLAELEHQEGQSVAIEEYSSVRTFAAADDVATVRPLGAKRSVG
jgi:hypothetical protein